MNNYVVIYFYNNKNICDIKIMRNKRIKQYRLREKDSKKLFQELSAASFHLNAKSTSDEIIIKLNNTFDINKFINICNRLNLNIQEIKPRVKRNNNFLGIIATSVALTLSLSVIGLKLQKNSKQAKKDTSQITNVTTLQDKENESVSLSNDNNIKIEETSKDTNTVSVYLDFDDLSNTDKALKTKELYYDIIEKYSKKYGLDPNLVLSIATQERGIHSSSIDSNGAVGLMQIQYSAWIGEKITYYELNEKTGNFEKITKIVTEDMIRNEETNIQLGCIILQECLRNSNYNIPVAIQMYNMGRNTMKKILNSYSTNLTDVSPTDLGWLQYRKEHRGDPKYLENVNKWAENNSFTVTDINKNEKISIVFTNENEEKLKTGKTR